MNELRLNVGDKIYWFKIGLRGIMYLQSLSKINVEDIFTAGMITLQPELSNKDINKVWEQVKTDPRLKDLYRLNASPFLTNVRDLYSQIVGELGISPALFFQMTPDECELAYRGYLRRQSLTATLNKLAYIQAKQNNSDEIDITPTLEYETGDILERENTFQILEMNNND